MLYFEKIKKVKKKKKPLPLINGRYFALQRKFQSLPIRERCPSNPLFNDQDRYFRIHGNFGADAAEDKFCNSVHATAPMRIMLASDFLAAVRICCAALPTKVS